MLSLTPSEAILVSPLPEFVARAPLVAQSQFFVRTHVDHLARRLVFVASGPLRVNSDLERAGIAPIASAIQNTGVIGPLRYQPVILGVVGESDTLGKVAIVRYGHVPIGPYRHLVAIGLSANNGPDVEVQGIRITAADDAVRPSPTVRQGLIADPRINPFIHKCPAALLNHALEANSRDAGSSHEDAATHLEGAAALVDGIPVLGKFDNTIQRSVDSICDRAHDYTAGLFRIVRHHLWAVRATGDRERHRQHDEASDPKSDDCLLLVHGGSPCGVGRPGHRA